MNIVLVLAGIFILSFSFVLLFGAPYLPTLKKQTEQALDLLDLKPGQTLLELGSGDGRVLVAAAKRGLKCVGYELNPFLFVVSLLITLPHRKQIKLRFGNYWQAKLPKAEGIYVFLLQKYMAKLDKKVFQTYSGEKIKLVSLAFKIPNRKIRKSQKGLYLYQY